MPVVEQPQHMQALARANRVRLARAELKRSIARGDVDAADVVRECPWETESMTLAELLTSQRRWGRTRARKFLIGLALNENKKLGTLTSRQRSLLSSALTVKVSDAPSEWLDGLRFAEWLRTKDWAVGVKVNLGPWCRPGARASVYAADKALTAIGLHLADVPQDLFLDCGGEQ